jgi:hypothetical protein
VCTAPPCAVIVEFLAKDVHAQRCRTPHEQIDAGPCAVPISDQRCVFTQMQDPAPCQFSGQRCVSRCVQMQDPALRLPVFRLNMSLHLDAGPCAAVTSFQARHDSTSKTGPCDIVISVQAKDVCTPRCRTLLVTNFQAKDVSTPRSSLFADLYQLLKCTVNKCRRNGNTTRQTLLRLFKTLNLQ